MKKIEYLTEIDSRFKPLLPIFSKCISEPESQKLISINQKSNSFKPYNLLNLNKLIKLSLEYVIDISAALAATWIAIPLVLRLLYATVDSMRTELSVEQVAILLSIYNLSKDSKNTCRNAVQELSFKIYNDKTEQELSKKQFEDGLKSLIELRCISQKENESYYIREKILIKAHNNV